MFDLPRRLATFIMLIGASACGCQDASPELSEPSTLASADPGTLVKTEEGKSDASVEALLLNFDFEGKIKLNNDYWPERYIEQQLLYTVGQLNGDNSVGRLDKLELSNIRIDKPSSGGAVVHYRAHLIVAWGDTLKFPETYTFKLPYDGTSTSLEAFTEKYKKDCVDWSAHDVEAGNMWYFYRPRRYGCELDPNDVTEMIATVSPSEISTTGKYPEYHKVWEDDALKVMVIFGQADKDAEPTLDAAYRGYKTFFEETRMLLGAGSVDVSPEVDVFPTGEQRDIELRATLEDGRSVQVNQLFIKSVDAAGFDFDQRYHELSREADLIIYNGHSGLGANIRSLARKGDWREGQYVIVFMNGCDTYAYVDEALFDAHAAVNPDDEIGTRYVDLVTNAMPSYFFNMSSASYSFLHALLNDHSPLTYEQIFTRIDHSQVVLVSGEADNTFSPGEVVEPVAPWEGLQERVTVERTQEWRYETPALEAGSYRFVMEGTKDADLYVRRGLEPTIEDFDCRPYRVNSQEACEVTLEEPGVIHVMVRGWSPRSEVSIEGLKVD